MLSPSSIRPVSPRPYGSRRGGSLIEFGFVAFVLLVVLFGLLEFCRMGLVYTNLANAARVGVRYAITHGSDRSSGTAGTSDICGTSGVLTQMAGLVNTSLLNCTFSGLGGSVGSTVQVTVTYPYDPWFNITPFAVTLSASSEGIITY
jgi:Flp pilus assembly protein TadG